MICPFVRCASPNIPFIGLDGSLSFHVYFIDPDIMWFYEIEIFGFPDFCFFLVRPQCTIPIVLQIARNNRIRLVVWDQFYLIDYNCIAD
jgi:hypothetical protein